MACKDCDKKPEGAPDDSVRNAAALWVSAGKNLGFVEGARWAIQAMRDTLEQQVKPQLDAIASNHIAKHVVGKAPGIVEGLLRQRLQQMELQLPQREADASRMSAAAVAMADRLERPARRGIRARFVSALLAFRA